MPYLGDDWRSPGQKWIRTEFGWKPMSEVRRGLCSQIVNQIFHLSPISSRGNSSHSQSTTKRASPPQDDSSSWRMKAKECSRPDHITAQIERSTSQCGAGVVAKKTVSISGDSIPTTSSSATSLAEDRLKFLQHVLSMRCVSIGKSSSRESNHYSTISDAVHKLNFQCALCDKNCFPFICKVLCLIFESYYRISSGSLQMTLLRLVEAAMELAMDTRMHGSLVRQTIDQAIAANEIVRREQMSSFAVRNVDSKIKSLLRMKRRLLNFEQGLDGSPGCNSPIQLLHLPDDCLRHIISYLTHPRDVLNLGQTNIRLNVLTGECKIWRGLTYYHYGQDICNVAMGEDSWMDTFCTHYRLSQKKLRMEQSSFAVMLCKICNFVYWKSYGHPCCGNPAAAAAIAELDAPTKEQLTPQAFMNLFSL